jgi:hypothetical protein
MFGFVVLAAAVPGTLWAVTAQNVALQDPSSGITAAVDGARRVLVTETAPSTLVRILASANASCFNAYTVPAGRSLILKSATHFLHGISTAGTDVESIVYPDANCSGSLIAAAVSDRVHDTVDESFGAGIPIPSGRTISSVGFNNAGTLMIYGYLGPASNVPASISSMAVGARAVAGGSPTTAR